MKKICIYTFLVYMACMMPAMAFDSYFIRDIKHLFLRDVANTILKELSYELNYSIYPKWTLKKNYPIMTNDGLVSEYHFLCNDVKEELKSCIIADIRVRENLPIEIVWLGMIDLANQWIQHSVSKTENSIIYTCTSSENLTGSLLTEDVIGQIVQLDDRHFRLYEFRAPHISQPDELVNQILISISKKIEEKLSVEDYTLYKNPQHYQY